MPNDILAQRLACLTFHVERARPVNVTLKCVQLSARKNVELGFARRRR